MFRVFLWLALIWFIWKVSRSFTSRNSNRRREPFQQPPSPQKKPFTNVQDAEFEDITPKPDKK